MSYRTIIGAKLNGVLCYFDLDTCTSRSVTSNANVAQYPAESGDTISDHMYRNPRTLNLSGRFSLAGKNNYESRNSYDLSELIKGAGEIPWDEWLTGEGASLKNVSTIGRLEAIEQIFEFIQEKGILCTILMCEEGSTSVTRFKVRENMALSGISWTEEYNSMQYSFTFTEIIPITTPGTFEVFNYNEKYPSCTLPATKSLGTILIESGMTYDTVLECLMEWGYIAKADAVAYVLKDVKGSQFAAFNNFFQDYVSAQGLGLVVGVTGIAAAGITIGIAAKSSTVAGAIAAAGASTGGVALVVALAAMAVAAVIYGAVKAVKAVKAAKRLKEGFNLIQNYSVYVDSKTCEPTGTPLTSAVVNTTDLGRLRMLLEDVQYEIECVLQDVSCYSFTSDSTDNTSRDMYLQVGTDILTVRVLNDNGFHIQLYKGCDESAAATAPLFGDWPVVTSLYDMDPNLNAVYRDSSRQYTMYLWCPYEDAESQKVLSNYYFIVASGNMKEKMNSLTEVVVDALGTQGYVE